MEVNSKEKQCGRSYPPNHALLLRPVMLVSISSFSRTHAGLVAADAVHLVVYFRDTRSGLNRRGGEERVGAQPRSAPYPVVEARVESPGRGIDQPVGRQPV